MATLNLYLDKRNAENNFPVKLVVRSRTTSVMVSLGVSVTASQWDAKNGRVINHPQRNALNGFIKQKYNEFERVMLELFMPDSRVSAKEIKSKVLSHICKVANSDNDNLFLYRFNLFAKTRNKTRTREIYNNTINKIKDTFSDAGNLLVADITPKWLRNFDNILDKDGIAINTRAIHMRNIRAVIRDAINDGVITDNPFQHFVIRTKETAKRSLKLEQIRGIFNYRFVPNTYHTKYFSEYMGIIKLIFFLRGINIIDLLNLKKSDLVDGYIEYARQKTSKRYVIKVEPEAMAIIERFQGKGEYLLCPMDRHCNYKQYAKQLNHALQIFAHDKHVTTYWLRHSWATLCINKLHIPKEIVSAGLGHDMGNRITAVYIDFDQEEIDAANRKLMDLLLYDKLPNEGI